MTYVRRSRSRQRTSSFKNESKGRRRGGKRVQGFSDNISVDLRTRKMRTFAHSLKSRAQFSALKVVKLEFIDKSGITNYSRRSRPTDIDGFSAPFESKTNNLRQTTSSAGEKKKGDKNGGTSGHEQEHFSKEPLNCHDAKVCESDGCSSSHVSLIKHALERTPGLNSPVCELIFGAC